MEIGSSCLWSSLLSSDLSPCVGNLDPQLLGPPDELSLLLGADIMGNLSTEGPVVHEEHFKVFIIPDQELLESIGKVEPGLAVATIAALGHGLVAAEASSDSVVNTPGASPAAGHPSGVAV